MDTSLSALKKASLMAAVSLVLGILFDYFFNGKILGVAFPLYVVLILGGLFIIAALLKQPIKKEIFWIFVPLLFFSSMVAVRSSELLTALNVIASLLLLLAITTVMSGGNIKNFLAADYLKIFLLPFRFLRPLFQSLSDIITLRGVAKNQQTLSQVFRGIVIAIPVLVIFAILFASADLIFQKYLLDLIDLDIEADTMLRALAILCVTFAFIGAYTFIFQSKEAIPSVQKNTTRHISSLENGILLGSINILFFIFLLVQIAYLFGGENNISLQGFTYAEYARRGFFELIAVAIISLLLLLTVEKYRMHKEKILNTLLVAQVIAIMVSAFMRLSLYEKAYGFTALRLYSHAFIILLAVIFVSLGYKIHRDKTESAFAFRSFLSIILFLAAMNMLNPDAFIARRNIELVPTTGKLDLQYLYWLSDDAIPPMMQILSLPESVIRKKFEQDLVWLWQKSNDVLFFSPWQSWNFSRTKAEQMLDKKVVELNP